MTEAQPALGYGAAPLCSMGLLTRRVTESVVGRALELGAVEQELSSPRGGMYCLVLEGEPGIGKTRLLLSIEELARAQGSVPLAVTADEEIRGPFLLARSIFASPALADATEGTGSEQAVRRLVDALSNHDDPGLAGLPPDQKLLRVFDLAAVALRMLSADHPLVVLIDDLQWADEDSLRMLRYVVRTDAASRILLVFAVRPDELALANEAVTLFADLERMGLLRRIKVRRFTQVESTEFLQQVLGGEINASSAAIMHAQAEGVPFILVEQVHSYRDAGLIQQVDGVWTLARNAERLLPSAVRTLIQRRSAHFPDETRSSLAQAAVLGRSFSLRDLQDVKTRLGETVEDIDSLAESLAPAVAAGLLIQHGQDSPADYSFTHGQIREYASASLTPPRRRAVHAAIVDMLMGGGDPAPGSLPLLAQHALAAGQADLCARFSIEGARAGLDARAPEEALRLVELAHPVTTAPQHRVSLLCLRDEALEMLRRPDQRLEGLAELAALADALGDSHLEMDVTLRRAAAMRLSQEQERAAELARRVRQLAAERGDKEAELLACLELGQDLLRTELGEAYAQTPTDADLDGAAEAFERAETLAEELGDEAKLADATRELGIIAVSHIRAWFVAKVQAGEHIEYLRRIASGERLEDILPTLPMAPLFHESSDRFRRALEIYERLGDRQGAMSTIIAMAFVSWGPEIHLSGSARRIEEIRRLMTRLKSMTKESDRALAEAQMLFGSHVYARAKVFPDVALEKGAEAYRAARSLGDQSLEFASAGGMAMAQVDVGALAEAETWLGRASALASAAPTPLRALQLESWRGILRAAAGDAAGMREHLQRAVQLATDQGRPAPRCQALARLALEAARLGAAGGDGELMGLARHSAEEAKGLVRVLPGHPPWGAQADAALARVATAQGGLEEAAVAGRAVLAALDGALTEDVSLEILLPACEALIQGGSEDEAQAVRDRLRLTLALIAQRIADEEARVRWFRGPYGRELTRLAGRLEAPDGASPHALPAALDESDLSLLRLLAGGRTNREIAEETQESEEWVGRRLTELFVKIGVSSRADATTAAVMGNLV